MYVPMQKYANGIFISIQKFHKMLLGETTSLYLFGLKRLLGQTMVELAKVGHDQLLIHQLLTLVYRTTRVSSYK